VRTTLVFRDETWQELLAALKDERETGGFLVAGAARGSEELTLLVRELRFVADEHYLKRTKTRLSIASQATASALAAAATDKSVAVFVHTHPKGKPSTSIHDRKVDRQLHRPALTRTGQPFYVSLIIGGTKQRPRFSGRVYDAGGEVGRLERIRVVGDRLQVVTADDGPVRAINSAVFERQVRAFGRDAQKLLAELRVGVVGAGGTGSAVFEQLVRLGVGEIVVVDDDCVSESNIPRIHESGKNDENKLKVDVMNESAERIGLGTTVTPIEGKATEKAILRRLKHCDVVFGCTDDHTGRQMISKLALWYLIPVIDTGFVIKTTDRKQIRGLYGRATTVVPGAACLVCRNYATSEGLNAEALPPEEREARAREGYVEGLGDPDPAVGTFTTMVASFAVSEMLDRLVDYSAREERPTELLIRLHERKLSTNSVPPKSGHWCTRRGNWGRGDAPSFLGAAT
jgi:molybdopterin/thiamine biosynthesis adenylyltransferase/proteasome lid subunit RPN8/RPN11